MISQDDIDAFAAMDKACERAAEGLHVDRYGSTDDMRKIFTRAIPKLYALAFQAAAEAQADAYRRGLEAMKLEGE